MGGKKMPKDGRWIQAEWLHQYCYGYVKVRWDATRACWEDEQGRGYTIDPDFWKEGGLMEWLYPEEGQTWEEGDEIVAEYTIPAIGVQSTARMEYKIVRCCEFSYYAWEFEKGNNLQASDVHIIAYMPYVKPEPPEPPEKPQDCPFCGNRMEELISGGVWYLFLCEGKECQFSSPYRETKAEAIKALNSVRVVTEEEG